MSFPPAVAPSAAKLAANAPSVVIGGSGSDGSSPSANAVLFGSGAAGAVTAASSGSLTVQFSTPPASLGPLTAVVTANGGTSGSGVQVATVVAPPAISPSSASLAASAPNLVIAGTGFDPDPLGNSISLSSGSGEVIFATTTSLTVMLTRPPSLGPLTASVTSFGGSSGANVQVATVVVAPAVTPNAASRLADSNANLVIAGTGFDPNPSGNTLVLSSGTYTITAATSTQLTVSFSVLPGGGSLTTVVTSFGVSSGAAVQVAAVVPVVTPSSADQDANAASLTIAGFGFDPSASGANNVVTFNLNAVGAVVAANETSLTVSLTTLPTSTGQLTAVVTSYGQSSNDGTPLQVAAVRLLSSTWTSVASSSTGQNLAAVSDSPTARFWLSANNGTTWLAQNAGGAPNAARGIASSSDGTKLAAAVNNGTIWLASNAGTQSVATWNVTPAAVTNPSPWIAIASSTNGLKLVAAGNPGTLWLSTDAGQSFAAQTTAGLLNQTISSVASSSDGSRLVATVTSGRVW